MASSGSVAPQFARGSPSSGSQTAPRLGIVTGDDLGTYVAIVAALLNGSTYVPLNSKAPLARNLDIVRDADVAGILDLETQ